MSISLYPIKDTKYIYKVNLYSVIGESRYENDQEIIRHFLDEKSKSDFSIGQYNDNVRSWRTGWNTHISHPKTIQSLLRDIFLTIRPVDLFGSYTSLWTANDQELHDSCFWLLDSWINIQEKNDYVVPHHHYGATNLSFVYYLESDQECSPIVFQGSEIMTPAGIQKRPASAIGVRSGDLLLFDSSIIHHVEPTKKRRINFAGNMILTRPLNFGGTTRRLMDFANMTEETKGTKEGKVQWTMK